MLLNKLNLNSLVVFQQVYEQKSMTFAARKLAMTQPGVSQHINGLERDLNLLLFIRDHKTIIPTKHADSLYAASALLTANLESTLMDLTDDKGYLDAEVVIGVPQEFGNNIIMPILAQLHHDYPQIKFNLVYGFAGHMSGLLEKGEIDFAFVDDFLVSKGVVYEKVYEEELILCCSKKYLSTVVFEGDKKSYEKLSYASYVPEKTVLKEWFSKAMGYKDIKLNTVMHTEDTQGIYAFIKQNMGIGIIPKHMYIQKQKNNQIHAFTPKYKTVTNAISLAYLEKRIDGPFMAFMYDYLKMAFKTV